MARCKLSDTRIKTLTRPGVYSDGDGLFLRVRRGGSRQWLFIYRRGATRKEIGLGGYGQGTAPVSLALARDKADVIRDQLARGIDPTAERRQARVVTFADCMEGLIEAKRGEWSNPKHAAQWEMTLRSYAAPLHDLPVAEIAVGDVKACLLPHWSQRPETAQRLRARIAAVMDYAIAHGWRTAANPARWRGLLDKLLPRRQQLTRGHHHALAYVDAPRTAAGLRAAGGVASRAVEFLMLTATRSSEARLARFSEIDHAGATWTIPAERMKARRAHVVPLTERALAIVAAMRERAEGELVFGGYVEGRPVSAEAMEKALRRASPDKAVTLHGMRSTFRDWAGDCSGFTREVAEAALAHVIGDKSERAYRRADALEKRRRLMQAWANYLGREREVEVLGRVVPIRRQK